MSQTLYRKYRSQRFSEIIGQRPVIRILQNSIRRERLSHAYLFCGPRGTGKTSIARIFAKAINCLNPQDGDACGVCENCVSIAQGNAVDVIEIDAASRNKVDDVRELRDRVGYGPLNFTRKVYIIDEAHMITTQGFNALLKTLEEPPEHVLFCLCTTEAHKLPITILSRCIRLDFQRLPGAELSKHLIWIAGQEGFSLEEAAALELVELAEGSARDAISLLDQLSVYCTDSIRLVDVQELFQQADRALLGRAADLIEAGEPAALIELWNEQSAHGADAGRFLLGLSAEIKERFIARREPGLRSALEALWQALNLLKFESYPALLVQLALLKAQAAASSVGGIVATPALEREAPPRSSGQVVARAEAAPQARQQPSPAEGRTGSTQSGPRPVPAPAPGREKPAAAESGSAPGTAPRPAAGWSWQAYLDLLKQEALTTYPLLLYGVSGELRDGVLQISFEAAKKQMFSFAGQSENRTALERAAKSMGVDSVSLLLLGETGDAPARSGSTLSKQAPDSQQLSPEAADAAVSEAELNDTEAAPARAEVAEAPESDINGNGKRPPTTRDVIDLFGATELTEED